jgi:hypothetical protein
MAFSIAIVPEQDRIVIVSKVFISKRQKQKVILEIIFFFSYLKGEGECFASALGALCLKFIDETTSEVLIPVNTPVMSNTSLIYPSKFLKNNATKITISFVNV